MKVAYSLTQFSHAVPGGTGVAADQLRTALITSPEPVEVVSVGARGIGRSPGWELPEPSVRFQLPYPALYEQWNRTGSGALDGLVPDADVAHLTLAFCPKRAGIAQVCTIHDIFPITHPEVFTRRGARVMLSGLDRVFERADLIATVSEASAEALRGHGVDASRLRVVPWGATAESFTENELEELRQRLGLPERFVMFAGTIEPRKNLDVLLEAMERADSDVHLALVGPAGWGDINERISLVPTNRMHLLGWQSRRDLLGLMTLASAVCMPSLAEGFGLPALEAMAQGTPVIHSECAALTEVVGGTGVEAHSTDPNAWASTITSFINDPDMSVEMGTVAKSRAATFTWERSAQAMRAVYEELS